jgi:tripartite-type tricarboxylate transporter receptor subunit TctC
MLRKPHAALFALALFVAFTATFAYAASYPTRAITIIVPQLPGGGTDIIARLVGHELSEQLGVPVLIENRPGAGTMVGAAAVARAAPDGYTLLAGVTASMAVNSSLFKQLPYDPIGDFTPVGMLAEFPFVLVVSKNFPAHSVGELIDLAKKSPGQINFGSGGNGTGQHLSGEMFKLLAGINLTHVPYRGSSPAYIDVISGRTPIMFDSLVSAYGQIKAGAVRALAVTSKKRSSLLPDVPTMEEAGVPNFENSVWFGLWAPRKVPSPVVKTLYAQIEKAISNPEVQAKVEKDGGEIMHTPLEEIEPFVKHEIAKWADIVKRANIRPQ